MNIDSKDPLGELVESHPLPTWRRFAWVIMVLLSAGLGWAFFTELDEVTVAEGVVVPKGDLKVVQHLEGGRISEISVREGSRVEADQILLQLDRQSAGLNSEELQAQLDTQLTLRARLVAEAENKEPVWPAAVRSRSPIVVQRQQDIYRTKSTELRRTDSALRQTVVQKEAAVRELEVKRKSTRTNLERARERLKDSAELLKQQLVPRSEHLLLEAEVEDLESEISTMGEAIRRTGAEVEEAKLRRQETLDRFQREAREQLGEIEQAVVGLEEQLKSTTERGSRLEVRSPIAGIVKNMRYTTVGGVVKAGEPIMEIIPVGEKLIVDAKLNPTDRGFVIEGQPARVKVSTYDFVRYGALDAVVTLVAADSTEDEEKGPFFQVLVEPNKNHFGEVEGQFPITAGMQATVDIHTGKRTVIDFLIRPVLKLKSEAFRER